MPLLEPGSERWKGPGTSSSSAIDIEDLTQRCALVPRSATASPTPNVYDGKARSRALRGDRRPGDVLRRPRPARSAGGSPGRSRTPPIWTRGSSSALQARREGCLALSLLALAFAAPAAASELSPTPRRARERGDLPDLPDDARHLRLAGREADAAFIRARIAAGDTKSEIKAKLVDEFGRASSPRRRSSGFNLARLAAAARRARLVGVVAVGVARVALEPRAREPPSRRPRAPPLDPELERRVDDELARFDDERTASRRSRSSPASSPSSRRACCRSSPATCRRCRRSRRSGSASRGAARRVVVASIPFIAGFTARLRPARRGRGGDRALVHAQPRSCSSRSRASCSSSSASRSWAPARGRERWSRPELVAGARRRGSGAARRRRSRSVPRRASARCSASILVLAGDSGTVLEARRCCSPSTRSGSRSRSCSRASLFARAMGAFRWLRDHYGVIQFVSGAILVALGVLFFLRRVLVAARLT